MPSISAEAPNPDVAVKLVEIGDGVMAVRGPDVNWAFLRDGKSFTLVDTGYPRYQAALRASMQKAGLRLGRLEAIVVTHAHIDHIGGVPALLRDRDVPVYVGRPEVPMATGAWSESATPMDVIANLWRPRFVPWSLRVALAGGAEQVKVPDAIGVADGTILDVPGRPQILVTPGHTSGHACVRVGRALLTGDALVTGHAVSGRRGPQLLANLFHHDPAEAEHALDRIAAVDASVIVPGHGPVWEGSPSAAVELVRQRRVRPAAAD